jgi:hypothetical protein
MATLMLLPAQDRDSTMLLRQPSKIVERTTGIVAGFRLALLVTDDTAMLLLFLLLDIANQKLLPCNLPCPMCKQ